MHQRLRQYLLLFQDALKAFNGSLLHIFATKCHTAQHHHHRGGIIKYFNIFSRLNRSIEIALTDFDISK